MAVILHQICKYSLMWLVSVIIIHCTNSFEPREASITPLDDGNTVNGVTVYRINTQYTSTSIDNNQWILIETEENSQFNLKVGLNQSWFMDPILPTAITLKLNGSNFQYTNGNLDLLLTVQLHSDTQIAYYTLLINLDNNGFNLVSPACTNNPITSMHQNDSYYDMQNNNNADRKCNIMQNDANNCVYDEIQETITNQWPYEFTVTNYPNAPNGYSTITYGNNSIFTCAFNEKINNDTHIEFWITPNEPSQSIKLSQIDLQSYFVTDNSIPTETPTVNPISTAAPTTTSITSTAFTSSAYTSSVSITSNVFTSSASTPSVSTPPNISNVYTTISTDISIDAITTLLIIKDSKTDGFLSMNASLLYIAIGIVIIMCVCCMIILLFYKKQKGNNNFKERNPVKVSMTPIENVINVASSDSEDSNENDRRQTDEMINNYLENQGIRDEEIRQIMNEGNKYNVVNNEIHNRKKRDTFHTHLTDITAVNAMVIDDVVNEMADGPNIRETTPIDIHDDNTIGN